MRCSSARRAILAQLLTGPPGRFAGAAIPRGVAEESETLNARRALEKPQDEAPRSERGIILSSLLVRPYAGGLGLSSSSADVARR
jgi:hypothetical protein